MSARHLRLLTETSAAVNSTLDLEEVLGLVASKVADALADSELAKKAMGPHIFDRYIELKRKEWDDYRVQLTDWEQERYLSVL